MEKFYPFFCQVVTKYVGVNAEEIQAEARAMAGARPIASIIEGLGLTAKQPPCGPTLPELVAQRREETLREKLAKPQKTEAATAAEKAQLALF